MDDFEVVRRLGQGSFGQVLKVHRKADGCEYAMKRVPLAQMGDREISDALNECRVLASVRHPRIVGYFDTFLDENNTVLCLVMEYCKRGDLAQKIERHTKAGQPLTERAVWRHLLEMTEGLAYLHSKGKNGKQIVVHRDLKPANAFITADGTIKLGDLNVCKVQKGGAALCGTKIGTPYVRLSARPFRARARARLESLVSRPYLMLVSRAPVYGA
jgi:NIMA (never in mitosis gene a)-related kinase